MRRSSVERRRPLQALDGGPWRDALEIRPHERKRRVGVEVAGKRNRRVRRMVVAAKERVRFVDLGRLQVRDLADRRPVVRMVRGKQRRQHRHRRQAVRTVLVVLPPLVQHHVALVDELLLRQRRQQEAHTVRFHPQREFERAGGHDFPIVRPISVGRAVQRRPCRLQRLKEAAVVVLRPFEHQMLEQMREARVTGTLVLRSDVIPDVDRDDGTPVRFVQQHVEAIGERMLAERNVQRVYLRTVRGMVGCLYAAIETCAAARAATSTIALAAGASGSLTSSGTPLSPPSRIGW